MKPRAGDFVLAAIIVVAALCIWIVPFNENKGEFAQVMVDGQVVSTLDLRGGNSSYTFNGVTVCVDEGSVYVNKTNCPDKVCLETGKISRPGQSIVCIPNHVSISIAGEKEIDAVIGG